MAATLEPVREMRLVRSPDAREILPEPATRASIVGFIDASDMVTARDYLAESY